MTPPGIEIRAVDWLDPIAVALREAMGFETGRKYAPAMAQYSEAEVARIEAALEVDPADIVATIVAFDGDAPVGHAGLRPVSIRALPYSTDMDVLEVKKVFVRSEARGRGISTQLMLALEDIALERGAGELILQTGALQVEAIALYEKLGYVRTPAFGAYVDIPFEVCFRKSLR